MKTLFIIATLLLTACATEPAETMAPRTVVVGWLDAEGHIHVKGISGQIEELTIYGDTIKPQPLGWGGASNIGSANSTGREFKAMDDDLSRAGL